MRRIEIAVNNDATAFVHRCAEHLTKRRSLNACCPEYDSGLKARVVSFYPAGPYVGDMRPGVNLDAEFVELTLGFG